jgi:hypothetical protein
MSVQSLEQTPRQEPLDVLSSNEALAHWQLDQEFGDIDNPSEFDVARRDLIYELINHPRQSSLVPVEMTYTPEAMKKIKEFKEATGSEEDLRPNVIRRNLAMKARWALSGKNPNDYDWETQESVERAWTEASNEHQKAEKLKESADRTLSNVGRLFAEADL